MRPSRPTRSTAEAGEDFEDVLLLLVVCAEFRPVRIALHMSASPSPREFSL
jgi:hypothetical protein